MDCSAYWAQLFESQAPDIVISLLQRLFSGNEILVLDLVTNPANASFGKTYKYKLTYTALLPVKKRVCRMASNNNEDEVEKGFEDDPQTT